MLFLNTFLHRILVDFSRLGIRKLAICLKEKQWFLLNRHFLQRYEKSLIFDSFSQAKAMKIQWKIVSNNVLFFDIEFSIFLSILNRFWTPKIIEKSLIFPKIVVRRRPLKHHVFRVAFWMAFEALGNRISLIFKLTEAKVNTSLFRDAFGTWCGLRYCFGSGFETIFTNFLLMFEQFCLLKYRSTLSLKDPAAAPQRLC